MRGGRFLLVLSGTLIGVLLGLVYAWILSPVEYVETAPASLRADFEEQHLGLIASAFAATGDLQRAQTRLSLLPDFDGADDLAALAQRRLAAGAAAAEVEALAELAAALGGRPPFASPTSRLTLAPGIRLSPTPLPTRTPTRTRTPTPPPTPTRTRTPTPSVPFGLVSKDSKCDPLLTTPLIQVEVSNAKDDPVPGVAVLVVWDTGQDRFFTGLKPEMGLGYADFAMQPDVTYSLQLAGSSELITGLSAQNCTGKDGKPFLGSWMLRFAQGVTP
jgi:hypothetical protein